MRSTYSKIILSGLLSSALLLNACSTNAQENKAEEAIPVRVAQVTKTRTAKPVHGSGLLSASRQMRLSFKIGGIVAKFYAEEGQTVRKGKVLAELDQSEISARYTQAKSGLEKARRDQQRVKNLYADSVATLEQMQNVQTALQVAEADYRVAAFNLKYAKITAPTDGKILQRFVEQNELVGAGTPIFYFASNEDSWKLRVGVADRDILRLQIGDSAEVRFDALPGKIFYGKVSEIAGGIDARSGTFETEISLPQNTQRLMSGFVANVDIFPAAKNDYWLVPASALVEADRNDGFVFLLGADGQHVEKTAVKVSHALNGHFVLSSGVQSGQTVVTDGAAYLNDGAPVEIVSQK